MIETALEPILLDVDLSIEEYDLDVDYGDTVDMELETAIKVVIIEGETYDGPYEAIPKIEAQTLETKNKRMTENVTVHGIPYAEVSNVFGGKTATIGGV